MPEAQNQFTTPASPDIGMSHEPDGSQAAWVALAKYLGDTELHRTVRRDELKK